MKYKNKLNKIKIEIKNTILERLGNQEISDSELYSIIDEELINRKLKLSERIYLRSALFDSFRRLDILSELLDDKSISEIMINCYNEIFIERNGKIERWNRSFENEEQLEELIQQVVSNINRVVNTSSPIVDARLADGSRVHVVLPPIALKGATVTIRKFPEPITMEKLVAWDSLTKEAAEFLKILVKNAYNIFISGATNSGKTSFLNALSAYIPKDERVITIEDSAELQIEQVPNLVSMESRNKNMEGEGEISISDLIRASLRMSPNRIIVGEVRGKESLDMLNAMNTGHDGSLSTGHANSGKDMLKRLCIMVKMASDMPLSAIKSMIASAIEIIIHLGRDEDGTRRVLEISEITGIKNEEFVIEKIFEYNGKNLEKVSELKNRKKLSH